MSAAGLTLYGLLTLINNFDELTWFSAVANSVLADLDPELTDIRIAKTSQACRALIRHVFRLHPQRRVVAQRRRIPANPPFVVAD